MNESETVSAPRLVKRPRKSEVIHVRVTSCERAALDAAAGERGEKLSAYLRVAALWQAGAPGEVDVAAADMVKAVAALSDAGRILKLLAKAVARSPVAIDDADRVMLVELREAVREVQSELTAYRAAAAKRAGRLPAPGKGTAS